MEYELEEEPEGETGGGGETAAPVTATEPAAAAVQEPAVAAVQEPAPAVQEPAAAVDFGPWNGETESLETTDWFKALPDDQIRAAVRAGYKAKIGNLHKGWLAKTNELAEERKSFGGERAAFETEKTEFAAAREQHARAIKDFEASQEAQRAADQQWLSEMLSAEADDTLSEELTRLKSELEAARRDVETAKTSGATSAEVKQLRAAQATLTAELEQTKALAAEHATKAQAAETARSETEMRLILNAIQHKFPAVVGDPENGIPGNDAAFEELCTRLERRIDKNGDEMFSNNDLDEEIAAVKKLYPDLDGDGVDDSMAAAESGAGSSGLKPGTRTDDYWALANKLRFGT